MRLVMPATAFCSWITSGRRVSHAATPPGPDTKPPAPSTTFGRRRRITCRLCQIASDNLNGAASHVANAFAAQPAHADPFDLDVLRRHELRFQPALRAEPHRLVAAFAQHARSRERRENVPAGAARHDEDGALHCARSRRGTASRPATLAS